MAQRQDASTGEIVEDKAIDSAAGKDKDGKPTMQVKVYSPHKIYFDNAATSISGEDATGPFDILAHHHNFIALLKPCELNIRAEGADSHVKISGGIMHVKADRVTVFLDV
ncbi:MAG: F0F1 ATP synthase subunit epsilon [Candidatus Saccharimonadales bacterium]